MAHLFSCCTKYGCCGTTHGKPTTAPTTASPGVCYDQYTTCSNLKAQLDANHGSCFTTDMGDMTGVAAYNGVHLADRCCASCQPKCVACLKDGNTHTFCITIGSCDANLGCSLSKKCTACMAQRSKAQCESYGVDCNCISPSTSRRRAQSGASAMQVKASTHASERGVERCSRLSCHRGQRFQMREAHSHSVNSHKHM